jgi:hypothetical protein
MSNLFRVKNGLNLSPVDLTTLTSPQAGDLACDINDLNKIKRYDASTLGWTEVGSGGGVGNVNALLTQTFDTAALDQFTQTGLALSTSNPIDGTQSARLIHQPATSQSFKQVIDVDRKYRGELMQLSMQVRSSASNGNLTLLVTDETNSATIAASQSISTGSQTIASLVTNATTTVSGFSNSVINGLSVGMTVTGSGIATGTLISAINTTALTITLSQAATASATITAKFSALPTRRTFSFTIPENCASMSYTITALQEAGLPESYIDDVVIELANVSLLETSFESANITAWQGYTPTFTGFGTPSAVEFEWRQVGENVEVRGKFTSGTTTATEARISLPNGYSSAGTGIIPSIQNAGTVAYSSFGASVFGYYALIEPSVSYLTVGRQTSTTGSLTKANGDALANSGQLLSFNASIPVSGLTATSTKIIALTQSGLIQEADSSVRFANNASGAAGFGTTTISSIWIKRFSTLISNIGDAISVNDSAANGTVFTATKNGFYSVNFFHTENSGIDTPIFILVDSSNVAQGRTGSEAGEYTDQVSWSGYLAVGQVVRAGVSTNATTSTLESGITVSYAGSLKQVTVNANSRITIPTSELRFDGASTKGNGDGSTRVAFASIGLIRGDAFSTVTDATGTLVTMNKAGLLVTSTTLQLTAAGVYVALICGSESQIDMVSSANGYGTATLSKFVAVGDTIKVTSNGTLIGSNSSLKLSFQEQDIQVSVSNILPQFSESDSSVRVDTANGYGSPATRIRRFSNTRENLGTDVEYLDSASNGASFTAKTSGVYNINYSDRLTTASAIGISKNASSLTTNIASLGISEILAIESNFTDDVANCSAQVYLVAGDIVRPHTNGAATGSINLGTFTMSKVGKPNVTGVDVTPFVNVPQPVSQHSFMDITQTVGISTTVTGALNRNTANGIFSYNSSTGVYTALKTGNYTISALLQIGATQVQATIFLDGVDVARQFENGAFTGGASCSYAGIVSAGSTFYVSNSSGAGSSSRQVISVLATASADTILTAPETFSTDTASLQYASSSTYTLSTLANAPVGTFITFTYAASTNTRTQTTTAPTQTTADMNANGMLIYTRAYNAASTAAQPAVIAIQIGKGLKGKSLDLYKSAGKATAGSLDLADRGSFTSIVGLSMTSYNETTGVLQLDAGYSFSGNDTTRSLSFSDLTYQSSGYLVVNASKNPALTGMNLNRIAARAVNTAGTIYGTTTSTLIFDATKTYDTHNALNAATGIFTSPESGYYKVDCHLLFAAGTYTVSQAILLSLIKNGSQYPSSLTRTPIYVSSSINAEASISDLVFLSKGDTVNIAVQNERGNTALLLGFNWFSISKVSV